MFKLMLLVSLIVLEARSQKHDHSYAKNRQALQYFIHVHYNETGDEKNEVMKELNSFKSIWSTPVCMNSNY